MAQAFPETAHKQYIGNKKYQDNWEHIFGGTNGKKDHQESNQEDCQEGSQETNNQKEDDNARN